MDYGMGSYGSFGVDQSEASSGNGRKSYNRHTPEQINRLESYFKDCPNPNENQRRLLGDELGLDSKQIKFWFQNKRTQAKSRNEKADNSTLRADNEKMRNENLAMQQALKGAVCTSCNVFPHGEEDKTQVIQNLKLENATMKAKYDKMVAFLTQRLGEPFPKSNPESSISDTSMNASPGNFMANKIDGSVLDRYQALQNQNVMAVTPLQSSGSTEKEKENMIATASGAMRELIKLMHVNEPLWIKSPVTQKYVIDYAKYNILFPKGNHLPNAHLESSKEFALVPMSAAKLVNTLLDAGKCKALFPNIINHARTIYIVDTGMPENHDGSLQLMYQKMHSLSPLVQPREFYFLRACHQLAVGVWIISDISYNISKGPISLSTSLRRPSGCMIQETPNGFSKVTWIEHVEVNDSSQTDSLYWNLVCDGIAYGAERWVTTLDRMCERLNFCLKNKPAANEAGAGCLGVMQLSHRMVREFCAMLCMTNSSDSPLLTGTYNSGVRISFRKNRSEDQSNGMVINAVASFWLPVPSDDIFNVLNDENARVQWDVLSGGNPVQRVACISSGNDPRNYISILRSLSNAEKKMMTLQESYVDALGSTIVYAPIDYQLLKAAIAGDSYIPIINPSGIVISPYGWPETIAGVSTSKATSKPSGSLVTIGLQILAPFSSPSHLSAETIEIVNGVIGNTVRKVKAVLNCHDSV